MAVSGTASVHGSLTRPAVMSAPMVVQLLNCKRPLHQPGRVGPARSNQTATGRGPPARARTGNPGSRPGGRIDVGAGRHPRAGPAAPAPAVPGGRARAPAPVQARAPGPLAGRAD